MNLIENKQNENNFVIVWKDCEDNRIFTTNMKASRSFVDRIYNHPNSRAILYLFKINKR